MNHRTIRESTATCIALLGLACSGGGNAQTDGATVAKQCLDHHTIRRTRILNDRNIVFVMKDDSIFNSELPRQCPSLQRNSLVNYAIANRQVCAGSMFQVLWQTAPGSYLPTFTCQLGSFVPITEDELATLTAVTDANPERRRARGRSTREVVTTEQVELPPRAEPAPAPPATPAQ